MYRWFNVAFFLLISSPVVAQPAEGPTLPATDAKAGPTRAEVLELFMNDCHAVVKAPSLWDGEAQEPEPECTAREINQVCAPDYFGCMSEEERCIVGCQPVCSGCQDTCAATCDTCKTACKGSPACLARCAGQRADCRDGCMTGLRQCQGAGCDKSVGAICAARQKDVATCSQKKCDAYSKCLQAQSDYEVGAKTCAKADPSFSQTCRDVCEIVGDYSNIDGAASAETEMGAAELAAACTPAAECPADYAAVVPFLSSFCAGTTDDGSLAFLAEEVKDKAISKRTLGLVFNAYGAIHGYTFKQETWMNAFFYSKDAKWLPPSCRERVKSKASEKVMPYRLTLLRDRVKKIWNAAE